MPNMMKIALFTVVPLALILGAGYGLAKVQVIPTQKMGNKNPSLARTLKAIGLYTTPPKPPVGAATPTVSPEQQALQAQKEALEKERAAWETQKQAQAKLAEKAKETPPVALTDPHAVARMASIYEQMPPENIVKIFAKLPDPQVVAMLRRMDEKRVGEILAAITPERAAFFTQQLSRPAAEKTASSTP